MTASNDNFHFEYNSDCLRIRVLTRHMLTQKEAAMQALASAIKAQPIKAALVDIRAVTGPYTFADRFELGELAGQHLRGLPVAVVGLEEQLDPERIGRMVARNLGANLEIFTDMDAAQAWVQKYLTPAG